MHSSPKPSNLDKDDKIRHYAILKRITSDDNWIEVEKYFDNKLALLYKDFENSEQTTEKLWELKGKAIGYRSILKLKAAIKRLHNQGEE